MTNQYWDDFYKTLHWDNIPNWPHIVTNNNFTLFWESILAVINKTTPVYVYFHNNTIEDLEQLYHSSEIVDYLNEHGLDIYLYEPLISYIEGQEILTLSGMFYHEFNGSENIVQYRAKELDSIMLYIKNNKLNNVTVRACEYNVEKYYPFYKSVMNLVTDNLFIQTFFDLLPQVPNNVQLPKKKFICLNWRYTKHRHLISSYLADKSANLSWYFKGSLEKIVPNLYFDIEKWKIEHAKYYDSLMTGDKLLNDQSPRCLDVYSDHAIFLENYTSYPFNKNVFEKANDSIQSKQRLYTFFQESFCAIVTESRFAQPTSDFSEKTYLPINFKKPFILVAPPKTLEYLKTFGFKSFADFWDESYDDEYDHGTRFLKILQLIDYITELSSDDIIKLSREMSPIIEHNFKILSQKRMLKMHRVATRLYRKKSN